MSELGTRKLNAAALDGEEANLTKRNKVDDSDSSTADTSSEGQEEGDRLQRMSNAIRTIIEVRF